MGSIAACLKETNPDSGNEPDRWVRHPPRVVFRHLMNDCHWLHPRNGDMRKNMIQEWRKKKQQLWTERECVFLSVFLSFFLSHEEVILMCTYLYTHRLLLLLCVLESLWCFQGQLLIETRGDVMQWRLSINIHFYAATLICLAKYVFEETWLPLRLCCVEMFVFTTFQIMGFMSCITLSWAPPIVH